MYSYRILIALTPGIFLSSFPVSSTCMSHNDHLLHRWQVAHVAAQVDDLADEVDSGIVLRLAPHFKSNLTRGGNCEYSNVLVGRRVLWNTWLHSVF